MATRSNAPTPPHVRDLAPRARDLNRKLTEVIGEFRRYYPDTTDGDIRRALEVTGEQHTGATPRRSAVVMILAGLVAAGIGTALATGGRFPTGVPPQVWVGGLALIAGVLFVLRRSRRRG